MIAAGNIFSELALALRRTMSPVRKASAAPTAAGDGEGDGQGGAGNKQLQQECLEETSSSKADDENKKEMGGENENAAPPTTTTSDERKKRTRFEPLPPLTMPSPVPEASTGQPKQQNLRRRRQSVASTSLSAAGHQDISRTQSVGSGGGRGGGGKRNAYKRRQSVHASVAAASTSPHIHPELTLEKLKAMQIAQEQRKSAALAALSAGGGGMSAMWSFDNDLQLPCDPANRMPLEMNTMFDFHGPPGTPNSAAAAAKERVSRPRSRCGVVAAAVEQPGNRLGWNMQHASKRRSSVAVMASGAVVAQAEKDHLTMIKATRMTLRPQSRSAVHYLAISPPRIRITDAQGGSDDYFSSVQNHGIRWDDYT
jgi:hypothetical protein